MYGKPSTLLIWFGIIGAAGRHDGVLAHLGHLLGGDFRIGIGHRENDRLVRHGPDHLLGHRAFDRQAEKRIGAGQCFGQRARRGLGRVGRFPLVHAIGAALIDDPLGVAQDDIVGREADGLEQLQAGDAGGAGAVAHQLGGLDVAPGQMQRVDQSGRRDDGGAVLVVMEHRDIQELAQALLDHEAFGGPDVLQIDAAPALAEKLDGVDEFVRILGRDLEIDGVDIGEALEQHHLAFHHRLGGERPAIAQSQDGGAIGDDGDEIALGGVVVGTAFVLRDGEHRNGDAGRIGERKVALGRHRLGGDDLELAGPALAVKQQRFLVGKGRPLAAAVVFCSHINSLAVQTGPTGGRD